MNFLHEESLMKFFIYFLVFNSLFINFSFANTCKETFLKNSKIPKAIISAKKSVWKILIHEEDIIGEDERMIHVVTEGTGFFISPNQMVTNFHIARGIKEVQDVELVNGKLKLQIKRIQKMSEDSDLAILEIEGEVKNYLPLKEGKINFEEDIFVPGYPFAAFSVIKKTGPATIYKRSFLFPTDHSILIGASGSPVLNKEGQVVGVLYAAEHNLLHGIKLDYFKNFLLEKTEFNSETQYYSEKQLKKMKNSIDANNSESKFLAATLLYELKITEKNKEIVLLLNESAAQGYAPAQHFLGGVYYEGNIVSQDYKKALHYSEKSADQGYAPAQHFLGTMYYEGNIVSQDDKKALHYLEKSADQGYVLAQHFLGTIYYEGEGVPQDYKKALHYSEKSADQGYAPAQHFLGTIYYEGEGVSQDYRKTIYYFKKSADQGYAPSQYSLGFIYLEGKKALRDNEKALHYLEKSATQGYALAQHLLGLMHDEVGVPQDDKKNIYYIEKQIDLKSLGF